VATHPRAPVEDQPPPSFDAAAQLAARLDSELSRVIIGQTRVKREVLTCLFAGGHCLLRGVPGLAKTLLIKTLAAAVSLRFSRIQFTPDLMAFRHPRHGSD
jgi:MoxR-like ATPase